MPVPRQLVFLKFSDFITTWFLNKYLLLSIPRWLPFFSHFFFLLFLLFLIISYFFIPSTFPLIISFLLFSSHLISFYYSLLILIFFSSQYFLYFLAYSYFLFYHDLLFIFIFTSGHPHQNNFESNCCHSEDQLLVKGTYARSQFY